MSGHVITLSAANAYHVEKMTVKPLSVGALTYTGFSDDGEAGA